MAEFKDPAMLSDDDLIAEIEKLELRKERQKARNKGKPGGGGNWAKTKAKMEADPDYKAEVIAKRKAYHVKRNAKLMENPTKLAELKTKRSAYSKQRRTRELAILAAAKERGLA